MIEGPGGILQFSRLRGATGLVHGILTPRVNVSFSVGEGYGDPIAGRKLLLEKLAIDPANTIIAGQVHGTKLAWVSKGNAGAGALVRGTAIPETDALATKNTGVGLLVTGADCPPVLIYSQKERLLALVHSGWRGTAEEIVTKTIGELRAAGASAAELFVGIGPGIGVCCYEVGDEVAERVPANLQKEVLKSRPGARPHLHLSNWIESQALWAGVPAANIEKTELCTSCRRDLFFSHRGEKGKCGRFGFAAMLQ